MEIKPYSSKKGASIYQEYWDFIVQNKNKTLTFKLIPQFHNKLKTAIKNCKHQDRAFREKYPNARLYFTVRNGIELKILLSTDGTKLVV